MAPRCEVDMMENRGEIRPTLKLSLITLNAALYASVGYLTYLGLFTPIFGTVRFWPAVIKGYEGSS